MFWFQNWSDVLLSQLKDRLQINHSLKVKVKVLKLSNTTWISCTKKCLAVFWTSSKPSVSLCSEERLSCFVIGVKSCVFSFDSSSVCFVTCVDLSRVSLSSTILLKRNQVEIRQIWDWVPGVQTRPYECPAGEKKREEGNWTRGHCSVLGSLVSTGEPQDPAENEKRQRWTGDCSQMRWSS